MNKGEDLFRRRFQRIAVLSCLCAFFITAVMSCSDQSRQSGSSPAASVGSESATSGLNMPAGLPQPVISGNMPLAIPAIPPNVTTPEQARPFFDYFSWQEFIALNWPAASGSRGVPDQPNNPQVFKAAANGSPVVWGAYRNALDLFESGNQRPPAWDAPAPANGICAKAPPGVKVFEMTAKGSTVLDDVNESFSYPLIDQFKHYASFEITFNQVQYDFIRGQDSDPTTWRYLLKNITKPVTMPSSNPPNTQGSIMLKAAWREMVQGKDDFSRYYVIDALVYDLQTKTCQPKKMGLVGFHIVQKLQAFPQWIWSTFEQIDNVERHSGVPASVPLSFNNGTNNPPTIGGYANKPPNKSPDLQPIDKRVPVQVTRLNPIPTTPASASTVDINRIYQQLLAGTVWQYYELVFTQWPSQPDKFTLMEKGGVYPNDCGVAFPANGITNTTMETYFQSPSDAVGAGGNSCMSCHYRADSTDFSWALKRRAH